MASPTDNINQVALGFLGAGISGDGSCVVDGNNFDDTVRLLVLQWQWRGTKHAAPRARV